MEALISEILIICQNVQCGSKLAGEFSFIHKSNTDYDKIIETINNYPELKYLTIDLPEEYAREGWRNFYIYKYDYVSGLIYEIEEIKNKDSALYHFAIGKLFGYNDYEVIQFISKNCHNYMPINKII